MISVGVGVGMNSTQAGISIGVSVDSSATADSASVDLSGMASSTSFLISKCLMNSDSSKFLSLPLRAPTSLLLITTPTHRPDFCISYGIIPGSLLLAEVPRGGLVFKLSVSRWPWRASSSSELLGPDSARSTLPNFQPTF